MFFGNVIKKFFFLLKMEKISLNVFIEFRINCNISVNIKASSA